MANQQLLQDRLNLTSSLNSVMGALPREFEDKVAGICIYNAVDADHVAVVANVHGPRSDQAHQAFLANRILDSAIPLEGTSVHESLRSDKSASAHHSGYRADQICVNASIGAGEYRKAPPTISIVFDQSRAVQPLSASQVSEIETLLPKLLSGANLDKNAIRFDYQYGQTLKAEMGLSAGRPKDAFLLYCDINGSSDIGAHFGFPAIYNYLRHAGQRIFDIAADHGGYGVRANGDDVLVLFPCTDLPDEEKSAFFQRSVMQAVSDIHEWYGGEFVAPLVAPQAHYSSIAMAASYGVHNPVRLHSRFNDVTHDGEPFYRVSEMMKVLKSALKEGRSTLMKPQALVIDETVLPFAPPSKFTPLEKADHDRAVIVQQMHIG